MSENDGLVLELHDMWAALDPPPAGLADRVLFTLQLANLDLELELMRLQHVLEPTGARGHETARTVTFSSDNLTVMITLSGPEQEPRRIDGWIVPGAPLRVELRTSRGSRATVADTDGRFAFPDTPAGQIQLVFHPTDDTTGANADAAASDAASAATANATDDAGASSTVLTRTVVTPAIQL